MDDEHPLKPRSWIAQPLPEHPEAVIGDLLHALTQLNVQLGGTSHVHQSKNPAVQNSLSALDRLNQVLYVLQGKALAAEVDGLTGLKNRTYFDMSITQHFALARKLRLPLSVMMLDKDKFKQINDDVERGGGHQVGDEVLQLLAREMAHNVRLGEGELCRYGGEEFAMILPAMDDPKKPELKTLSGAMERAIKLASRILHVLPGLSTLHRHDGSRSPGLHQICQDRDFSTSIGLAVSSPGIESARELIKLADLAALEAKERGRNRLVVAKLDEPEAPLEWMSQNKPRRVSFDTVELGPTLKWDYKTALPDRSRHLTA